MNKNFVVDVILSVSMRIKMKNHENTSILYSTELKKLPNSISTYLISGTKATMKNEILRRFKIKISICLKANKLPISSKSISSQNWNWK